MGASIMDILASYPRQERAARAQADQSRAATALTQQQAALMQQQATGAGIENQEKAIGLRDAQVWSDALRQTNGDPTAMEKALMKGGISGPGWLAYQKNKVDLAAKQANAYRDQQEGRSKAWSNEQALNDQKGSVLTYALGLDPATRAQQGPSIAQRLQGLDPQHDYGDLSDEKNLRSQLGLTNYVGKQAELAKTKADAERASAETARAQQQTAQAKREQAVQELSGLTDPRSGAVDPQAYAQWVAAHPEMRAPSAPSSGWFDQTITSAVPIDKQPDYLIQKNLSRMKPEDFSAQVDKLNLPRELAARTKTLVTQALAMGDRKGAIAAIKDASDQVGRTETAVRTAQATAPIKVNVWGQERALTNKYQGQKPATMYVPDGNGSYTATSIRPGDEVPAGAVTAAAMSTLNVPSAQTRAMAEKAPRVLELITKVNGLLDANEKQLGPLQSRWNEFTAGKIGLPNQGYTQLRTNLGLLSTALMNMHVGARGGDKMMAHFKDLIDGAKQDPVNLRAALGEISDYARNVKREGGNKATQAGGDATGGGNAGAYVRTATGSGGHQIGQKADGSWWDMTTGTAIK